MKFKLLAAIGLSVVIMSSCVSKKAFEALQSDYDLAKQQEQRTW